LLFFYLDINILDVIHLTRKSADKVVSPEEDLLKVVTKLFTAEGENKGLQVYFLLFYSICTKYC